MITNGRIVAVNFVPGSGGKFIQNCLALSRHCVLKIENAVRWQSHRPFNKNLYDQKFAWALKTVPSTDDMHNWLKYELRDDLFFGRIFSAEDDITAADLPEYLELAGQQNIWITYSAHSHGSAQHLEKYWPTVKYVCLTNADQFLADWAEIKNHNNPANSIGTDWQTPPGLGFDFDIDSCIYNEAEFLKQMRNLYEWLDWEDFDNTRIPEYYRAYIGIHSK